MVRSLFPQNISLVSGKKVICFTLDMKATYDYYISYPNNTCPLSESQLLSAACNNDICVICSKSFETQLLILLSFVCRFWSFPWQNRSLTQTAKQRKRTANLCQSQQTSGQLVGPIHCRGTIHDMSGILELENSISKWSR